PALCPRALHDALPILPAVASRDPLWGPKVASAREPAALATARRQTTATSALEARPELFLRMPGDSIWPALAAAALLALFGVILLDRKSTRLNSSHGSI